MSTRRVVPPGSAVPAKGALRFLYQRALEDNIDWKASAFWQKFFQEEFPSPAYSVLYQQSPDESKLMVDIMVLNHGQNNGAVAVLVVQCTQESDADIKRLERATLDAAQRYLDHSGQRLVYAMSTSHVRARAWLVQHSPLMKLEPLFGADAGCRSEYVDAGGSDGYLMSKCCSFLRGETSLEEIVGGHVENHVEIDEGVYLPWGIS